MAIIHRMLRDRPQFDWEDVLARAYDGPTVHLATRRILIGPHEGAPNFHLRYFEVQPGGYTTLDQHPHDHGVILIRGRARVRLADAETELACGDVVYIPGNEIHQFFCVGDAPMGFLCIVPARR